MMQLDKRCIGHKKSELEIAESFAGIYCKFPATGTSADKNVWYHQEN